ncbi:MAG: hypothetical protein QOI61_1728, partial [Actinomycetota bacterium]
MRLRSAAVAAAGVVAAIGLSSHEAAADPPATTSTTAVDPVGQATRDEMAAIGAAIQASKSQEPPPGDGPVHPEVKVLSLQAVEAAPPPVAPEVVAPVREVIHSVLVAPTIPKQLIRATRTVTAIPPPAIPPLTAAPAEAPADPKTPTGAPVPPSAVTIATAPTVPATPPDSVAPATASDAWYPHEVAEMADQRIAERMRNSPVRGPPPSTAQALGNDARNTTTQVA